METLLRALTWAIISAIGLTAYAIYFIPNLL